jgi:hypothetical protein
MDSNDADILIAVGEAMNRAAQIVANTMLHTSAVNTSQMQMLFGVVQGASDDIVTALNKLTEAINSRNPPPTKEEPK